MCGHVEEKEVLLLGTADALVDEILRQAFTNVAQLIFQLQRIPAFT